MSDFFTSLNRALTRIDWRDPEPPTLEAKRAAFDTWNLTDIDPFLKVVREDLQRFVAALGLADPGKGLEPLCQQEIPAEGTE